MVPFCQTPREGQRALELLAANGLMRGENGLEVVQWWPLLTMDAPGTGRIEGSDHEAGSGCEGAGVIDRDAELPSQVAEACRTVHDGRAVG